MSESKHGEVLRVRGRTTLLVALLVVLAGCAGGAAGGGPTDSPAAGPGSSDDPDSGATGTADSTATAAAGGTTSFPTDLPPAVRHERALERAGSFTSVATVEMTANDTTRTVVVESRVDTVADRYVTESRVESDCSVSFGTYTERNRTYVRVESDGVAQYRVVHDSNGTSVPRPDDVSYAGTMDGVLPAEFDPGAGETVSVAGEEMTRYEVAVDGFDSGQDGVLDGGAGGASSTMTADSVTVVVHVDRQGIARRLAYDLTVQFGGQSLTQRVEIVVKDVGATEITEPGWVPTAREQTDGTGDGGYTGST